MSPVHGTGTSLTVIQFTRYAMGDCATIKDHDLPATAQVAYQKAIYLGEGKSYFLWYIY